MNLKAILKMFGVNVAPEHVKAAEELIPRLPAIVKGGVDSVSSTIDKFHRRLERIEAALVRIEGKLEDVNSDSPTRPAGIGATQRALESGTLGSDGNRS